MRARRALLYMPGDDMNKIRKAASLGVDCACLDMEDAVALNRKNEARQTVIEALRSLDFGATEKLVRINAYGSGLEADDLQAVLTLDCPPSCLPHGIVLPKVASPEPIRWAEARIEAAEKMFGRPAGQMRLIVVVESAGGIVELAHIAAASPRLEAIIFGAEDFASDIGAIRTREGWEVFYARSAVVTHAVAFGLQAIDMVNVDFHDLGSLKREALQGAQLGFAGKQIIHPNQIAPVQEAFTPSDEAIAQALRIVAADAQQQQAGRGAYAVDGKMIDAPIVKAAQRVLTQAKAAGKLAES